MNTRSVSILVAAAIVGGAGAAQAVPLGDKASVELFAGGTVGVPGSFSGIRTQPQDAPVGSQTFDHVGFDEAYEQRYTGGVELDYAFDPRLTGFARASDAQFDGKTRDLGTVSVLDTRTPVDARFADNSARALDLGARYMFAPGARLRPFIGLGLGASDQSAPRAFIDNPDGSSTRVELAKGGTVFEQRLETGVQISPLPNFDLRLTAAANHLDGQKSSGDPNLELLGVAPSHSTIGPRWQYPAELGAVWHF
jgi:opacity protein-like surface antigen